MEDGVGLPPAAVCRSRGTVAGGAVMGLPSSESEPEPFLDILTQGWELVPTPASAEDPSHVGWDREAKPVHGEPGVPDPEEEPNRYAVGGQGGYYKEQRHDVAQDDHADVHKRSEECDQSLDGYHLRAQPFWFGRMLLRYHPIGIWSKDDSLFCST